MIDAPIFTRRRGMRWRVAAAMLVALAPALATAKPATPAPVVDAAYRINPGDVVDIYVWGDERLQRTLTVLPDGTLAFPLAGTITAAGKTPKDIEAMLSRLLASQYKGQAPQVTVSVRAPAGMQFSVIGKVRSPGTFSPTRYVSVLEALTLAGGPTDFADLGNVVVLRHTPGGKTTVIRTRLTGVLKGKPSDTDLSDNGIPQLVAGDTVVVP